MTNPNPKHLPTQGGDPTEIELDPRYVDLVIRQAKALSAFTSTQAQERLRLALTIRKEVS